MFITFEGGEGSGKTTLIKSLALWLDEKGIGYVTTREPGGSMVAEKIRDIILDQKNTSIKSKTEALLFAASRIQHLEDTVLPALESGKVVLCDRYLDSSLAYQGFARNLGFDAILKINAFALEHLPDITYYIDSDPKIGLSRISNRVNNRLDFEALDFHEKVHQGYLEVAKMFSDRIVVIDGNRSINEIIDSVKQHLESYILCQA